MNINQVGMDKYHNNHLIMEKHQARVHKGIRVSRQKLTFNHVCINFKGRHNPYKLWYEHVNQLIVCTCESTKCMNM